jgi:hypothetical protein
MRREPIPLQKNAIRSFLVRRTKDEQPTRILGTRRNWRPKRSPFNADIHPYHFVLQALFRLRQNWHMRCFDMPGQRRLRFAGLLKPMLGYTLGRI